jgi:hypothetical protein
MRSIALLLSFLAAIGLAGCGVHPVQQDVTGIPTAQLVDYIRCETRLAIQNKAIRLLRESPSLGERALRLADEFEENRDLFIGFDPKILSNAAERAFYNRYILTGIAFDFTFDITEMDRAAASLDPVRLITRGTLGIGINASAQLNRENRRHFIVSSTFKALLDDVNLNNFCKAQGGDYRGPNFVYPIAGQIGMTELISTFIDLNEGPQLQNFGKDDAHVFADTLSFTTTFDASVSPHLVISPVGHRIGFAPSSLLGDASRTDLHQVIIGLSLEPLKPARPAGAAFAHPLFGPVGTSVFARRNISSPAEQRAVDAIAQQRYDNFLDKLGSSLAR